MDERTLDFARDLERRDEALADSTAHVQSLLTAVEDARARAGELATELASAPDRERAASAAVARAGETLAAAGADVEAARTARLDAEAAGDEGRLAAAREEEERADDVRRRAGERLARAQGELEEARWRAERAGLDAAELERRAQDLAARVAAVPRLSREGAAPPGSGLAGVGAWASHARAALWVVRSGLQNERDRVVREANELASSALGEPLAATSVRTVRTRLERSG